MHTIIGVSHENVNSENMDEDVRGSSRAERAVRSRSTSLACSSSSPRWMALLRKVEVGFCMVELCRVMVGEKKPDYESCPRAFL